MSGSESFDSNQLGQWQGKDQKCFFHEFLSVVIEMNYVRLGAGASAGPERSL